MVSASTPWSRICPRPPRAGAPGTPGCASAAAICKGSVGFPCDHYTASAAFFPATHLNGWYAFSSNGRDITMLQGRDTVVAEGDDTLVFIPIAGGSMSVEDHRFRDAFRHPGMGGRHLRQPGLSALRGRQGHRPAADVLPGGRLRAARRLPAEPAAGSGRRPHRGDGQRRHRQSHRLAHLAGGGPLRAQRRHRPRPQRQRRAGRRHRQVSGPADGLRRAGAQGPAGGRGRAGALRQGAGLQGLEDPLQLRRLLHRRAPLLAHPGQGRGAGRGHLPAPGGAHDQGAAHLRAARWPARRSASAWRPPPP